MNQTLTISIQKTLAYFDQFLYPLSAWELYQWLWQPPAVAWADFVIQLEQMEEQGTVASKNGWYFLPGSELTVAERSQNFLVREKKLTLARQATRWLALIPFVEGILVCNTVAAGWPKPDSDIDLFVLVMPRRLWLTRWLFTAVTALLNKRRHGKVIADHLCLSFYTTSAAFNLSEVRVRQPDIYLTYWIHQLVPIFVHEKVYGDFLRANAWTKSFLPHSEPELNYQKMIQWPRLVWFIKKGLEKIVEYIGGTWLEKMCRHYQIQRMNKRAHGQPPHVVISDSMLKFHEADRREEYQNNWEKTCQRLGIV